MGSGLRQEGRQRGASKDFSESQPRKGSVGLLGKRDQKNRVGNNSEACEGAGSETPPRPSGEETVLSLAIPALHTSALWGSLIGPGEGGGGGWRKRGMW